MKFVLGVRRTIITDERKSLNAQKRKRAFGIIAQKVNNKNYVLNN